ncbi:MAG TPA: ribulose-phosphate 3-epimerase, partial [Candidatus Kapabacteria bacterium]|nr:ribulose-phosphate 3-epimerase [Candidatus Kapabacteria bacterium]
GGQSFINSFHKRARTLRKFLDDNNLPNVEIEVDGGVKLDNVREIADSGANILVSGSGLFKGDLVQNIKAMRKLLD